MSASSDLQDAIIELLGQPGALRVNVPLLARVTKSLANDIEAAAAQKGLCIFVMPPLEQDASNSYGLPAPFFDRVEVRVRIVEQPAMNGTGATAYDLKDDVIAALHAQPKTEGTQLAAVLTNVPLYLASRPVEMVEDQTYRILDVIFNATYGFQAS